MNRKVIFITGGARSGKSSFALREASRISGEKAYIATAEALDDEMKTRIERHRRERGSEWDTFEEQIKISEVIKRIGDDYRVIVIDCLTVWLSNLLHAGSHVEEEIEDLVAVLKNPPLITHHPSLFIISNEVGTGIVPDNDLARRFRDMAGILNQKVAEVSDEAFWIVAGMPVKIKTKGEGECKRHGKK